MVSGLPISDVHAWYACVWAQPCLTLCDPVDSSLPDSSVRGIFLAKILEWVNIFSSQGTYLT